MESKPEIENQPQKQKREECTIFLNPWILGSGPMVVWEEWVYPRLATEWVHPQPRTPCHNITLQTQWVPRCLNSCPLQVWLIWPQPVLEQIPPINEVVLIPCHRITWDFISLQGVVVVTIINTHKTPPPHPPQQ